MNHIQPLYYEQSSQIFQIVKASRTSFHDFPIPSPSLQVLLLIEDIDSKQVLSTSKTPLDYIETVYRPKEMAARLKSQCGPLLEVVEDQYVDYLRLSVEDFIDFRTRSACYFLALRVHSTLKKLCPNYGFPA